VTEVAADPALESVSAAVPASVVLVSAARALVVAAWAAVARAA
jgi:hypothetical protein